MIIHQNILILSMKMREQSLSQKLNKATQEVRHINSYIIVVLGEDLMTRPHPYWALSLYREIATFLKLGVVQRASKINKWYRIIIIPIIMMSKVSKNIMMMSTRILEFQGVSEWQKWINRANEWHHLFKINLKNIYELIHLLYY
jgi:hypothetical protein